MRLTRHLIVVLPVALAFCAFPVAPALAATPAPKTTGVSIRDAWARATPAGAHMGAIYLSIVSATADRLTGAAVPHSVAGQTQIHETVMEADSGGAANDRMSMREVGGVDLPAGEPVDFKPGGYHVMLIDLKKPLVAGQKVQLTLTLAKAGKQKVTATVRDE